MLEVEAQQFFKAELNLDEKLIWASKPISPWRYANANGHLWLFVALTIFTLPILGVACFSDHAGPSMKEIGLLSVLAFGCIIYLIRFASGASKIAYALTEERLIIKDPVEQYTVLSWDLADLDKTAICATEGNNGTGSLQVVNEYNVDKGGIEEHTIFGIEQPEAVKKMLLEAMEKRCKSPNKVVREPRKQTQCEVRKQDWVENQEKTDDYWQRLANSQMGRFY